MTNSRYEIQEYYEDEYSDKVAYAVVEWVNDYTIKGLKDFNNRRDAEDLLAELQTDEYLEEVGA